IPASPNRRVPKYIATSGRHPFVAFPAFRRRHRFCYVLFCQLGFPVRSDHPWLVFYQNSFAESFHVSILLYLYFGCDHIVHIYVRAKPPPPPQTKTLPPLHFHRARHLVCSCEEQRLLALHCCIR